MIVMSESELNALRRKKLRELQRRLAKKEKKTKRVNADNVLDRIFRGRAWEVFQHCKLSISRGYAENQRSVGKTGSDW